VQSARRALAPAPQCASVIALEVINVASAFRRTSRRPAEAGRYRRRYESHTPRFGPFTRAYFQFSTPPLNGAQSLDGVFSAAFHAIEVNRHINAFLALQVVVHRPDTSVRGVAMPVTADVLEFTVAYPPKSRAAQNWALAPVACEDGDVIAINVGIAANNQLNNLAQIVGFFLVASEPADISLLDDSQFANSWMEFSAPLNFY
jgi:hypothetical protein